LQLAKRIAFWFSNFHHFRIAVRPKRYRGMLLKDLKPPAMLIVAWRRPELLRQLIASIRCSQPRCVYIAFDAARSGCPEESEKVAESRHVVETEIDWDCKLERKFSENHQGCRLGVSRAISWFFENVDEGIILEDDCVAHADFFSFCAELLERYRNDERVACITGNNFQAGARRGGSSYYFSKYPHCWGWATWRRAWQHYSADFGFWPSWKRSKDWRARMKDSRERHHWETVFENVYTGQTDSWALPWMASVWRAGGLTATPQVNLVTNIGFGPEATHTKQSGSRLSIPSEGLGNHIVDPNEICAHEEADRYVFETVFARKAAKRNSMAQRIKDGLRRGPELAAASFYRRFRQA